MNALASRVGKDRARAAVLATRFSIGGLSLLAPRLTGRLFGVDPAANPAGPFVARMFAVRDLWLASEVLMADTAKERDELLRRHVYVDASDTLAALLGGARGYLGPRAAVLASLSAAATCAFGWVAGQD